MSKKLSQDIKSLSTNKLTTYLPKGNTAPDSYTVKELSSAYTRLRDMTRKTLQRQNKYAQSQGLPNYSFYNPQTGYLDNKQIIPTLAEMKSRFGSNEQAMKRALIRQMTIMSTAHRDSSIGTEKQRKKAKELIERYNKVGFGYHATDSNNPLTQRNNTLSAYEVVKKFMKEYEMGYEKKGDEKRVEWRKGDDIIDENIHKKHLNTTPKEIKQLYLDFTQFANEYYNK